MIQTDEDDLCRRALAAHFRGGGTELLSRYSGVVTIKGLDYVHLFDGNRTLAVFRVDGAGRLKRLRRYPRQLQSQG
jgi:hypothetical protein